MEFRISTVNRSRTYWVILGLFAAGNIGSMLRYFMVDAECCDQTTSIGFPFPFYASDASAGVSQLLVTGFLLDIVIAWTIAIAGAWLALSRQRVD